MKRYRLTATQINPHHGRADHKVTDSRHHDRVAAMDTLPENEAHDVLAAILRDPMAFVVDRLQACEDSSLHIATQVNVSASTIRTLRSGHHSGNLRVDVWAELVHWLLLPEVEETTAED